MFKIEEKYLTAAATAQVLAFQGQPPIRAKIVDVKPAEQVSSCM
jgi:hypothetical protein